MLKFSDDEIIEIVKNIWEDDFNQDYYDNPEIKVLANTPKLISFSIERMYEDDIVKRSFHHVKTLSEYFDTENVDDDKISEGGCETCDFGSSYGYTFYLRP